jgi:hypothetical protein
MISWSILYKFHKNPLLVFHSNVSSKHFSWIIMNSLGHLHDCQWGGKPGVYVLIRNKCLHVLNRFFDGFIVLVYFDLSKQCIMIRMASWMIYRDMYCIVKLCIVASQFHKFSCTLYMLTECTFRLYRFTWQTGYYQDWNQPIWEI